MNIRNLSKLLEGDFLCFESNKEIRDISIDSRSAKNRQDEVFIALKGPNHDAHNYIKELARKGLKNFIVEKPVPPIEGTNIIKVNSSLKALQHLARHKRQHFQKPVIGITGSNGKTIVKEWLSTLLSEKFNILKSPKSYNSQVGVPLSVWPLEEVYDIGIFEAGISRPGEMNHLQEMINPSIGIFTNIGTAHDEYFESRSEKILEKLKLFQNTSTLIFKDDESLTPIIDEAFQGQKITWSYKPGATYFVKSTKSLLSLENANAVFRFHFAFQDEASLENMIHSIICSIQLGLTEAEIQKGISNISPVKMRLELKKGINNTYLIDDTYNNDMEGLRKALDFLTLQKHVSKKSLILTDFLHEKTSLSFFEKLNELLLDNNIDRLIAIGPRLSQNKTVFTLPARFYANTDFFLKSDDLQNFKNELVLIKGARPFRLERVSKILSEKGHKTVLEINLDALTHNLNFYKSILRPETKIMVVVKALAYGAGSAEVSSLLEFHKVDYLAVAYADEGIMLRENGISLPIMVMNPSEDDCFNLIQYDLEPEIYSLSQLQQFITAYQLVGKKLPAHIILNTGMNRLGFDTNDMDELLKILDQTSQVEIKSIFTHLAASEDPEALEFTQKQISLFDESADMIEARLGYKPIRHVLNSGGIARHSAYQYDMIRLGIGLHGIEVGKLYEEKLENPATLKTVISQIRNVKAGDTIGYGRMGKADSDKQIATIAIGYADGYLRHFGNGTAYITVNGQKAPTIGNICMDMCMIDVTNIDANVGDDVVVFGDDPTVSQLATWSGTIPYEILTNVSNRVKRVFYTE